MIIIKLTKNQKNSIKSGGTFTIFDNWTRALTIPFALALGSGDFLIGIIVAIPYLTAIFEIPGTQLM